LDPDSIRSVEPDSEPDSESGSGSRREKNDPQKKKNVKKFFSAVNFYQDLVIKTLDLD
jgi:hypothetical protein